MDNGTEGGYACIADLRRAEECANRNAKDAARFTKLAQLFVDHAICLGKQHLYTIDDVRGALDYLIELDAEK
jgi:hypothetical protein